MSLLPKIGQKALTPDYFPTVMQAFIFRNWSMIPKARIALVLNTSVGNVLKEADRMGLSEQGDTNIWFEKGYITIIRSNWHLLPYDQLLQLLNWTEEKLALVLKEEDFLDIKLGLMKPDCEPVLYKELTPEQIEKTKYIYNTVKEITSCGITRQPFDFWNDEEKHISHLPPKEGQVILDNTWTICDKTGDSAVKNMVARFGTHMKDNWNINLLSSGKYEIVLSFVFHKEEEYHKIDIKENQITIEGGSSAGILRGLYRLEDLAQIAGGPHYNCATLERIPRFGSRYIYPFCALYESAFDVDSNTYCPNEVLEKYAEAGVNGIWLQAVLYRLIEFPYEPKYSKGWENRQKNLRDFVERAKNYGIKLYLYLNEPRTMPLDFFEKYPEMKGAVSGGYACMCLSNKKCREYLTNAVEKLCRDIPGLGGFFTITMSENVTHCKSHIVDEKCHNCENIPPWELAATANKAIAEGAHRIDPNIRIIAWDWGWTSKFGFKDGDTESCIRSLPKYVTIMCKRETGIPFIRGGIKGEVEDYAISVEGVSEQALKNWSYAKVHGHQTAIKLQMNDSWECSTVPYLPVYGILTTQMKSVIDLNINHLMLSWTLGGYPSPTIKLISEAFFIENGNKTPNYEERLRVLYGNYADNVKKATDIFCDAFCEFPFDLEVLYKGPQNSGVSNPLYSTPTGYKATMTCYCYDDIDSWRSVYPAEVLESQYKKVSDKWLQGLSILDKNLNELYDISYMSYSLFRSSYHQVRFIRLRDSYLQSNSKETLDEIIELIRNERELSANVYKIMCRRPEIGFEAANHYYYNTTSVLEKIINCDELLKYYESK